jgi:alpha-tubulin suppressor-like RCC1 family protein
MARASRVVLTALLLTVSMTAAGLSPAGAATATVVQISALTTHAGCARMSDGTVTCSGLNESGQLGNGTTNGSLTPVVVQSPAGTGPLTGVSQVVTGDFFACALLTAGGVDCWGDNSFGQLGNGTKTNSLIPVVVENSQGTGPLSGVVQVAAGKYHVCVRLASTTVDCWGDNSYYELGDDTNQEHLRPNPVLNSAGTGPLGNQVWISASQYDSCSVQADGSARCWGLNQFGVLGDGTQAPRSRPSGVKAASGTGFLANVKTISASPTHTCALLKTGVVDCWGFNSSGQLGDGTVTTRLRPVAVKNSRGTGPLVHVTQLTTGGGSSAGDHSCALLSNHTAVCWGGNFFGQLGDGTNTDRSRPVGVANTLGKGLLTHVLAISAGPITTCARTTGGTFCWGFDTAGQFGNGNAHNTTRPVPAKP